MRLCRRRAAVRKLCHFRPTLLLDKITLEVEPAGGGAHARANRIVAHRHNCGADAEAFGNVTDEGGQRLAGGEAAGAFDMDSKIAVAQTKPGYTAQPGQDRHESPGLVAPSPSGC